MMAVSVYLIAGVGHWNLGSMVAWVVAMMMALAADIGDS